MDQPTVRLILGILLALYFLVHIPLDIWMSVRPKKKLKTHGVKDDDNANILLGLSSLVIWGLWILYVLYPLSYPQPPDYIQIICLVAITFATFVSIWARITRGLYSYSWGLNDDTPLRTTGPYRFIRHPTYSFYFVLFIFLPILTGVLFALVSVLGIYGYARTVAVEEQLLIAHFGDAYQAYQKRTWKFIPFLW